MLSTTTDSAAAGAVLTLSTELREQTAQEHREAENAPLVRSLLTGQIGRIGYASLLGALLPVYRALEDAIEAHRDNPALAFLPMTDLSRSDRLEADLEHLGEPIPSEVTDAAKRSEYVARIRDAADCEPVLLLAHAYTRYMGDLSGGQILRRLMAKHFDLDDGGLSYFDFDSIPDVDAAKDHFRSSMDALDLDDRAIRHLAMEARLSFRLNRLLTQQVWQALPADQRTTG